MDPVSASVPHMTSIDDATAAFLERAAVDLQLGLRLAGVVDGIRVERSEPGTVVLAARILVGSEVTEARGSGDSLLTAYAAIADAAPSPVLSAAFREVLRPG